MFRSRAMLAVAVLVGACSLPDASPSESAAADSTRPATSTSGALTTVPSASATEPSQAASPTPLPRLDAADLAARIGPDAIGAHIGALQAVADANGGTRATGTPGYVASMRHVTETLLAAGYAPELETFTHAGMSGTNVLAERIGASRPAEVVMIGGHLDSELGRAGMNDNASGVSLVLALAEAIADLPQPERTIRFAFWDAEEDGPIGSAAHVAAFDADERQRIVAYLNFDMVGSPNAVRFVYAESTGAPGADALTDLIAAQFEAAGLAWDPIDIDGRSDHGPFNAAGIPTGGVFTGGGELVTDDQAARHGAIAGIPADACGQRACDRIDNVDVATAVEVGHVVAAVLASLAAP